MEKKEKKKKKKIKLKKERNKGLLYRILNLPRPPAPVLVVKKSEVKNESFFKFAVKKRKLKKKNKRS